MNIWANTADMVKQVNSYSEVLADSGLAPLSFSEGQLKNKIGDIF